MNTNTEWEPRTRSNLHALALLATAALLLATACSSHKKEKAKEGDAKTPGGPPVALAASSFALQAPPGGGARFIAEREGPLRMLSAVPSGALDELPPGLAVSVTFSRPMVPLGQETPPPAGAIVLTPPVAGRCRWEGTQTLVFEPGAPLPPATPFSATLAGGLRALDGTELAESFVWRFATPRPRLTGTVPRAGERFADPAQSLRLVFNLPVDPQRIERFVALRGPGGAVPVRVRADADTVFVDPRAHLARGARYEVAIERGLRTTAGPLTLARGVTFPFWTAPRLSLEKITQGWGGHEPFDPGRGIDLHFSTPVRFGALRAALRCEPPIAWPPGIEARDDVVSTKHTLPVTWQPETEYVLRVHDLADQFGQRLQRAERRFRTGSFRPVVRLPQGVLVIEAEEQPVLPLRALNVDSIAYAATALAEDQVVPALHTYDHNHRYAWPRSPRAAPLPPLDRQLELAIEPNQARIVPFRLDAFTGGRTGIVALAARGPQVDPPRPARVASAVAQVTRLGLTAKVSPHQILVLVTALRTAKPVTGAIITIRGADNLIYWRGHTDRHGRAQAPGWWKLGLPRESDSETPSVFVFARRGNDLAFTCNAYDGGLEPYRFNVNYSWWPRVQQRAGSVFTDRRLYRAGETVHFKGILRARTDADWQAITDSVRVVVESPRGETVLDARYLPDALGGFDGEWTAPASADLGEYAMLVAAAREALLTGRDRRRYRSGRAGIATGAFRVDAFRTSRFHVEARSAAPSYVGGDFFEGSVSGRYLYGAAMGGQPVRYELRQVPGSFTPPGYEVYRFGSAGHRRYRPPRVLAREEARLDDDGRLAVRAAIPALGDGRPTRVVLEATVEDPARQEMSAAASCAVHPALFYLGIKPHTTFLDLSREQSQPVEVIAIDPAGQPVAATGVTVELLRQHWVSARTVGYDGRLRWRSERTEEVVGRQEIEIAAGQGARLELPVAAGGSYVIRARARDLRGNAVLSQTYFYATGPGYVAWERRDDDRIDLVADRPEYRPGDTARIMVESPFEEATALVTIEREGILGSFVTALAGSAPEVRIPLGEEHLPNVFVSVILLAGRSAPPEVRADPGAPAFKIGYVTLRVDPGERRLQVELTPDRERYRPGELVTVALQLTGANGRGVAGGITFAAADAGVLDLVGYALPDPFDAFYGPRALGVTTAESRANLVLQRDYGQKEEDRGGGGGESGAARSMMTRTDFRPLAHWEPAIRTDRHGRATVRFRVPESLTTFRLMATGFTRDNRFGTGHTDIVVTQPLVLSAALPRFARLDDAFSAGVLVTNRSDAAHAVTVTARAAGLALAGDSLQTLTVGRGETREVRFDWQAPAAGGAQLTFAAAMDGEHDALRTALPIAAPAAKIVRATFASTEALAREALALPAERVPGLGGLELRLASTALVGLDGASRYLFDYPYGCLEQRTSRIRPLLLADRMLDAFDLEVLEGKGRTLVAEWAAGLRPYWTGNGFSLWRGGRHASPYVTAYTVLALAEARDAGFAVPEALAARGRKALARLVRNRSKRPDYYSEGVWEDTRALMLYALARHGELLASELDALAREVRRGRAKLSVEGECHLLRALLRAPESGGSAALRAHLPALLERLRARLRVESTIAYFSAPASRAYGWIYASDTRATAHGMAALIEADPSAGTRQLAQRMVRYLMQQRRAGHWASTQENAAVIDAFGIYFDAYESEEPDFTAEVRLAGQALLEEQFRGRSLRVATRRLTMEELEALGDDTSVEIAKHGDGRLYYTLRLETWSSAPQPAEARGLAVERRLQPLSDGGEPRGEPILTGGRELTVDAGDFVKVTLRVQSPTSRNYVVLDDALPAGLEALNQALASASGATLRHAGTGGNRWWGSFNHVEMHDDRVLLFADYLEKGEHTYSYVARATTAGSFIHPPARAELMYQPETYGHNASGRLLVRPPHAGVAAGE